jgi:hypothetical protein
VRVQATAAVMGVTDVDAACCSPQVLTGTVDEVKVEMRITERDMTYCSLTCLAPETMALCASAVVQECAACVLLPMRGGWTLHVREGVDDGNHSGQL